MANYQEVRVNLTNSQLNKLNIDFEDEELPHELFLTTRQKTKIRNAFANNMSTDIKLSKLKYLK